MRRRAGRSNRIARRRRQVRHPTSLSRGRRACLLLERFACSPLSRDAPSRLRASVLPTFFHHAGRIERSDAFAWGGRLSAVLTAVALTVCCAVLVWCFMTGDTSLEYVVKNRSDATGDLAWLFKLSGLWAGRAGSLLFWAWLISAFNVFLVLSTRKDVRPLDNGALSVSGMVLLAFLGVLLFSSDNTPFVSLDPRYLDAEGNLVGGCVPLGV